MRRVCGQIVKSSQAAGPSTYDDTKVNSVPSRNVVLIHGIPSSASSQVDDRLDLVLFKDFTQLSLVLCREEDFLGRLWWMGRISRRIAQFRL